MARPFPSLFPKKPKIQDFRLVPQVADHLVPNQVLGFFEFFTEREREKLFVSKGLQKPSRRRFRGIEDAPLAAYLVISVAFQIRRPFSSRDKTKSIAVRRGGTGFHLCSEADQ